MTAPANYQLVTTLLARKIMQAEVAAFAPLEGLSLDARCDSIAEGNRLWAMAEAVGLLPAVRQRIALAGPALLEVA